jgi:hypothetical protein
MSKYGFKDPEKLDPMAYGDFVMFTDALARICHEFGDKKILTVAGITTPDQVLEYFTRITREYVQQTKVEEATK